MLAEPEDRALPRHDLGLHRPAAQGLPQRSATRLKSRPCGPECCTRFGHGFFDRQVNISTGQAVARSGPVALLRKLGVLPRDPSDLQLRAGGPADRDSPRAPAPHLQLLRRQPGDDRGNAARARHPRRPAQGRASARRCRSASGAGLSRKRPSGWQPLDVYVTAELGTARLGVPRGARSAAPQRRHADRRDPGRAATGRFPTARPARWWSPSSAAWRSRCCAIGWAIWPRGFRGTCGCGRGLARLTRSRVAPAT